VNGSVKTIYSKTEEIGSVESKCEWYEGGSTTV